jgi:hypothetical protein
VTTVPLHHVRFDAAELMRGYRPGFTEANKRLVFDLAAPEGGVHRGMIEYSRWSGAPPVFCDLTERRLAIDAVPAPYSYEPVADGAFEWHVNFADQELVMFLESPLFAQDEIQAAEHPALGALRDALRAQGAPAETVANGKPTPVLVTGVERRCRIATDPDASAGRPHGLYGHRFALASTEVVRRATAALEPPPRSNLIAMMAPRSGRGAYDRATIGSALATAYVAFVAAREETDRVRRPEAAAVVHTGWWGCGAFGGNRELMAMLQVIAARMAGVDRLVFHAMDGDGVAEFRAAVRMADDLASGVERVQELVSRIAGQGYVWGTGNGT